MRATSGSLDRKLFTYLRYNADLTNAGLARPGVPEVYPAAGWALDSVRHIDDLCRVGACVAQQIRPSHYSPLGLRDRRERVGVILGCATLTRCTDFESTRSLPLSIITRTTSWGCQDSTGGLEQGLQAEVPVDVSLNNWQWHNCRQ